MTPPRASRTFALAEYSSSASAHWWAAVQAAVLVAEPSLRAFEVHLVESVPTTTVAVPGKADYEFAPRQVDLNASIGIDGAVTGDYSDVYWSVASTAVEEATARLAAMHSFLDGLTAATGQVDVERNGLTWDGVIRVLGRMDITIDDDGEPIFGLWPPSAQERYDALPPRTADQEVAWEELILRKREEARARSRDRRLR